MTRPDIKKMPGARKSKLPSFIPPQLAAAAAAATTTVTLPIRWPRLEASSCR